MVLEMAHKLLLHSKVLGSNSPGKQSKIMKYQDRKEGKNRKTEFHLDRQKGDISKVQQTIFLKGSVEGPKSM